MASAPGVVPVRRSSRWTVAASSVGSRGSRVSSSSSPRTATRSARRAAVAAIPRIALGGLHERGEVDAAQPADRRRRRSSRTACSRRSIRPPAAFACRAARPCCAPTPSASCNASRTSSCEAFRSTLEEVADADLLVHVVDGERARRGSPDRRRARGAARHRRRRRPRAPGDQQGGPADARRRGSVDARRAAAASVGAHGGGRRQAPRRVVAERLRALATVLELTVPYERGDVLAALHRDGEVLVEVHADHGTRVRPGSAMPRRRASVSS